MSTLDPGIGLIARLLLAFVFLLALAHKLRSPAAFVATVESYRLLPHALVVPTSWALIALEALAVAGLVAGLKASALLAVSLLALYTLAIGVNLARGRRDIDCGCSGPAMRQTLSGWLIARNTGLVALALIALAPPGARALTLLDAFTAAAALAAFGLLYSSANQLLAAASQYAR